MATTTQALQERGASRRAPTPRPASQGLHVAHSVEIGIVPTRAAKALAAAGLAELGITARYIIMDPHHDGPPFTVVIAALQPVANIAAARAFLRGLLFALQPPDPLAAEVTTERTDWARLQGRSGRAIQLWSFACGSPSCCVTASVRQADQGKAWGTLQRQGWATSATWTYLCPDCGQAEGGDTL